MQKSLKYAITGFFFILFMALISAPVVIMTVDDTVDTSCFFSISEEEDNHSIKILFDKNHQASEYLFEDQYNEHLIGYTFKNYTKPHLNLVFPPPDFIS
ncbi:hypothetical protein [Winogradskyella wichelsiae]|uniref:hypothetical protein n=1 Tax=Winogradskyella wichelsiae TaxID=2697007 RepID=UPI0015CE1940|nr:hypothetical protein [Winogradskyella wichelsiae]